MSLIINADGEYLSGSGAVFGASGLTEATMAIWVKRDVADAFYQSYAYMGRNAAESYGSMFLALNGNVADCWAAPSGTQYRVISSSGANSTAWQVLIFTYKKDDALKTYTGVSGGSLVTFTDAATPTFAFNADLDCVRIGLGFSTADNWYPRGRLAHYAFWDKALTATEAGELFNGGTAGAGKNPQSIQNANLKFYSPLTSDATVTVGGISLSATGTLTYDGADNPNVEAYGGGSVNGTATGATLTGTSSISAGSATGNAAGTAPGATLTGTSDITPGSAAGTSAGTAPGANLTGTSSITAGAATGGAATGSFTTQAMENNSGAGLLASTVVSWTWYQGAIGAAPTSTTHGTGTTNAFGILTAAGLPIAAGFLLVRTSDSTGVYYESGTPA